MRTDTAKRGVTLIEMLVVIAVLGLVLAGVYGVLASAFRSYNHNRAKIESQQNARIILDYLVYRLREVGGGRFSSTPEDCLDCHDHNQDDDAIDNPNMPCVRDVSVPERAPEILDLHKEAFTPLADIPAEFQNMTGNYIQFIADLLPLHGFNESYTDGNDNGSWDFNDENNNNKYDKGETELLVDLNDNNKYDYFGETWTLQLQKSSEGPYYELIESLDFSTLFPRSTKSDGRLVYDASPYDEDKDGGIAYEKIPVAYGIVGLWIDKVPRIMEPYPTTTGKSVSQQCADPANPNNCHGSSSSSVNVYGSAVDMDYSRFIATHPWWNVAGLSIEVSTTDTKGQYQQFTKLRQFVNFRNLEINQ